MNLLIVSEAFVGGGLETHIHTYYQELKTSHHITFAFGRFQNRLPIDLSCVHDGFHFKSNCTIQEMIEDIERLKEIIVREQIDVIHVHPFYSLYPVMIASQLTGVPVATTYHGIASFSFSSQLMDTAWYYYGMYELIGKIFTVSNTGKLALEHQFHRKEICFLPNALNLEQYRAHTVVANHRWAVISRLDADNGKEEALYSLFAMLPELEIEHIDVYGDGSRRPALMEYVKTHQLSSKVTFQGFQSDLFDRLDGKYNGVIGTDRVAIEGLAMGYPVIEMGYCRVIGVINDTLLKRLQDTNFDANLMEEIPGAAALNAQLSQVYQHPEAYNLRPFMEDHFNVRDIGLAYISELNNTHFSPHANVCAFYQELCVSSDKTELFFCSKRVISLMKKYVEYYAVYSNIKIIFLIQQSVNLLGSQMVNHVNGLNWRIDQYAMADGKTVKRANSVRESDFRWFCHKLKQILKKLLHK